MTSITEFKILKQLSADFTKNYTIRELSEILKLPYAQTHRNVKSLSGKKIVEEDKKGKSIAISLNFEEYKEELLITELKRKKEIIQKYSIIKILDEDLDKIKYNQFICILFGSYADNTTKKDSDVDLLFIIPEEYNYNKFEKSIKNNINIPHTDVQITTEEGLIDMWNTPAKFNVGNELLKKHIILRGTEAFLHLRRKYYVG